MSKSSLISSIYKSREVILELLEIQNYDISNYMGVDINEINIQKTNYQKIWQCQTCKMKIETKENKKTQCDICVDK